MYNPINKVLKGFEDDSRAKRMRPHSSVSALELVALFSFLPGMFILLYAFVLSAALLLAAMETEKGNLVISGLIFAIFGVLPGLLGLALALLEPSQIGRGIGLFIIYGGIGAFGFFAIYKQKGHLQNAS